MHVHASSRLFSLLASAAACQVVPANPTTLPLRSLPLAPFPPPFSLLSLLSLLPQQKETTTSTLHCTHERCAPVGLRRLLTEIGTYLTQGNRCIAFKFAEEEYMQVNSSKWYRVHERVLASTAGLSIQVPEQHNAPSVLPGSTHRTRQSPVMRK
ncbi:hypothetical protein V8C44DRAFT_220953 [Trichoderma aethiopicum]